MHIIEQHTTAAGAIHTVTFKPTKLTKIIGVEAYNETDIDTISIFFRGVGSVEAMGTPRECRQSKASDGITYYFPQPIKIDSRYQIIAQFLNSESGDECWLKVMVE